MKIQKLFQKTLFGIFLLFGLIGVSTSILCIYTVDTHLSKEVREHLKDQYPDRSVIYCFLIGVLILGLGYVFSYLLNDDRIRLGRPTLEGTLRHYGIRPSRRN